MVDLELSQAINLEPESDYALLLDYKAPELLREGYETRVSTPTSIPQVIMVSARWADMSENDEEVRPCSPTTLRTPQLPL